MSDAQEKVEKQQPQQPKRPPFTPHQRLEAKIGELVFGLSRGEISPPAAQHKLRAFIKEELTEEDVNALRRENTGLHTAGRVKGYADLLANALQFALIP